MNKILLSAIVASSLAVSGDLVKCSRAIDMSDKYNALADEWVEKTTQNTYAHETIYRYLRGKTDFYMHLNDLWKEEAKKECKGVLGEKEYKFYFSKKFQ